MLSKEFLASLTSTHWRGAGGEDLVPVMEMDPAWLENAYAMCVAWGFEQREQEMLAATAKDWSGGGASEWIRSLPLGALEICRERIPCFRTMEWAIAAQLIKGHGQ